MAEHEEGRKGGKGFLRFLLGLLAAIGAVIGALAFWRRRRGPEE